MQTNNPIDHGDVLFDWLLNGTAPARAIRTEFVYPPIPTRKFDWAATTDNYEPGDSVGYGSTEAEAVADLLEQMEDA